MKRASFVLIFALLANTLCAQGDTPQSFTRALLIEQFTTVNCGWCPPGADRISEAIGNSSNIIWIKHHAGFGTDFLTNDIHTTMTVFYGGSTFAPAMMVDRTRFVSGDDGPVGSVGQVSDIRGLFNQAKQVTTYCKVYPVQVAYDPATRIVTGEASGRFGGDNTWDENTRITLYLIEDSIVGEQHDYTSHGNWNDYVHMGTVRDAITDMWGDPLAVNAEDRTFSLPFTYTLPDGYNPNHCKVVAFVYQYDASNINNCPVLNAGKSVYLGDALGISQPSTLNPQLSIYPNPASSRVLIEADEAITRIEVVNSLGQKVYEQTAGCGQQTTLHTEAWPQGVYLVTVTTEKGCATRKLFK